MDVDDVDPAVGRWTAYTDVPLLILALVSVPLIVLEAHGNTTVAASALAANWVIWALFAVDLFVRTMITTHRPRLRYLVSNWFDVAIVFLAVIPFLRPIRVLRNARLLRIARSLRIVGFLGRFWQGSVRAWKGVEGRLIGLAVLIVLVAGSLGIWMVERNADGPIDDYPDALWWSVATVTTVGYGDVYPVTSEGRGIATLLMIAGIAVFGLVSANLAAMILRPARESSNEGLRREVAELTAAVERLIQEQDSGTPSS